MGDEGESNLEMRCSADEAWYDGTLRVSPESKDLVVVHFNDFDEEEDETFHRSELRDPAKLRSRVRVRSVQLQDSQCNRVYEGQKICGCLDDGEDRKYYDAEVTSIAKGKHSFKNDGEECLCKFTVFWLDGPRKRENTVVGCAEVCFLSTENPEDDPMVKNLLKSLANQGDQPRRKLVKSVVKSVPSPRPRTPSPSLELAPSKKQPSKEPSPPAAPPKTVLELARTKSLPIGSKKKRIMQAEEQLADLASDNDKVSAPKDSSRRDEEDATGHGNESEGTKGAEKMKSAKGKAKVGTPEVIDRDEPAREDNAPRPTFKERLKYNTKKMAAADKAARQDSSNIVVTQTLAERVKLKTAQKTPTATPDAAPAAATHNDAAKQDNIVQSLGERVKLKLAQKNPSPVDSPQKTGKQVVRKQGTPKRKLIQLEDPCPDPLRSKFDKVVKPRTTSKPKETAAAAAAAAEPPPSSNAEPAPKRKAGRPRKNPPPEPVSDTAIAKKPQVQTPQEDDNTNKRSSDRAIKKRPRNDFDDGSSQEEETSDADLSTGKKPRQHHGDTVSVKSAHSNEDDRNANEEAVDMLCQKISLAERFRDIQNKYHNGSSFSTPQAAQELVTLASLDPFREAPAEPDRQLRASSPFDNSGSHLEPGDVTGAGGKARRRAGRRQLVITDDEADDPVPSKGGHGDGFREIGDAAVDQCSPSSDPKNTCSALDEEVNTVQDDGSGVTETRLLVLENLEVDASALDALRLLQSHTEGVCAVHVLPVLEFQASATGYALYRDRGCALKALRWLTSTSRFVVSHQGRPWIISQAKEVYGPNLYGFASHIAYKSDDPGMCGIISDQPHAHDLALVTKRDISAYYQAQQKSKTYEEHKKWRKELYEQIVQHEKKG